MLCGVLGLTEFMLKWDSDKYIQHWEHREQNQKPVIVFLIIFFNWVLVWRDFKISIGVGRSYLVHRSASFVHHDHLGGGQDWIVKTV